MPGVVCLRGADVPFADLPGGGANVLPSDEAHALLYVPKGWLKTQICILEKNWNCQ